MTCAKTNVQLSHDEFKSTSTTGFLGRSHEMLWIPQDASTKTIHMRKLTFHNCLLRNGIYEEVTVKWFWLFVLLKIIHFSVKFKNFHHIMFNDTVTVSLNMYIHIHAIMNIWWVSLKGVGKKTRTPLEWVSMATSLWFTDIRIRVQSCEGWVCIN